MNLNELAQVITVKEGGKQSLSIAQVKEVLKLTLWELKAMSVSELGDLFKRVR